ncbi:MAG: NfeD family protein [Ruminococcus sp.]|nr:NfeD family protein [Ruminococcus sp.]
MLYIWAIAFVLFLILEVSTSMALISIWFSAAALITLIVSLFVDSTIAQCVIFVVVSCILLLLTRPAVKKLKRKHVETNAELNIGKRAIVTQEIDNEKTTGRVKLDGVDWMAISTDSEIFKVGDAVIVDKIEGAKLYVSKP